MGATRIVREPFIHIITPTDLGNDSGQSIRLRHLCRIFAESHPIMVRACGKFDAGDVSDRCIQQPLRSLVDATALRYRPFTPSWFIRMGALAQEFRSAIRGARLVYTDSPMVGFCSLFTPNQRTLVIEVNGLLGEEWLISGRVCSRNDIRFRMMRRIERASYRAADLLIVVSQGIKDYIVKEFGVSPDRIHVIPNGIESRLLEIKPNRRVLQEMFDISQEPIAIFIGGFRPWHGVMNLIRALPTALTRVPELKLVLVGDGPLRKDAEGLTGELDLTDSVIFTGYQQPEMIPEFIAAADVGLYYPSYDVPGYGFLGDPMKLREYMAMGKPVLVSRLTNFSEIVGRHQCGIVVDENPDMFGNELADLILDPSRLAKLGANGRIAMSQGCEWHSIAMRVLKLLDPVLE